MKKLRSWGLAILLVVLFLWATASIESCQRTKKPKPPPPEPKPPVTAEDVGKKVGRVGHNFGKGVIEGWKEK